MLVIVEGCDGVGKDLFIKYFKKYNPNFDILEPIENLREIVVNKELIDIEQRVRYKLIKSLNYDKVDLIVKRFFIAYEVFNEFKERNLDLSYINPSDFKNSITFYITASPKTIKNRLIKRGDWFVKPDDIEKLYNLYEKYVNKYEKFINIVRVNNDFSTEEELEEKIRRFGELVYNKRTEKITHELLGESLILKKEFEKNFKPLDVDHEIVLNMLDKVENELKNDLSSRQVYINLFDDKTKPCMVGIQFLVRKNILKMIVFFRSFEFLKFYDVDFPFLFNLGEYLKNKLNLQGKEIIINFGSVHIEEV